jgi:hypothetical protein
MNKKFDYNNFLNIILLRIYHDIYHGICVCINMFYRLKHIQLEIFLSSKINKFIFHIKINSH